MVAFACTLGLITFLWFNPQPLIAALACVATFWQLLCRFDAHRESVRERTMLGTKLRTCKAGIERSQAFARSIHSLVDLADVLDAGPHLALKTSDVHAVVLNIRPGVAPSLKGGALRWARRSDLERLDISDFLDDDSPIVSNFDLHRTHGDAVEPIHLLRVPLRSDDQILGSLGFIRMQEGFDADTRAHLESLGLELAATLARTVLYEYATRSDDYDYLTGLLNHRAISDQFQQFFELGPEGSTLGVLLMDVANFRNLNDTHGHAVGDDALRAIGKLLQECAGDRGAIGRTDGDEFMILLRHGDLDASFQLAEQLLKRIRALEFQVAGMFDSIPLEVHFGVASYPASSKNPFQLLALADQNLARAKNARSPILRETSEQTEAEFDPESFDTIEIMLTAIDRIDSYTRRHSHDVSRFATWISEELGDDPEVTRIVTLSALMHDLGKIAIPASILSRPGTLREDEYAILKMHPQIGATLARSWPGMEPMLDGISHHHERMDGSGYPDGLSGEEIPYLGRLIAVADALSAMTTDRPYRKGMSFMAAAERLRDGSGVQFCPICAGAMLNSLRSRGLIGDDDLRIAA